MTESSGAAGPATATRSITVPGSSDVGEHWPLHTHDEHELLWAVSGRLSVTTPRAHHTVPPGASIWIPAAVPHEVRAAGGCRLRCTWFRPDIDPGVRTSVAVLVSPVLFDGVMDHLVVAELDHDERRRAEAFAMDLLRPARTVDVDVPRPRSPWLVAVTDQLCEDPSDRRTVDQWAASCSVSPRTFMRTFERETGRPFARWRRDLRVRAAMQRLAAGDPAGVVARATGYLTQASFTTSFRRATGTTPAAFARAAAVRGVEADGPPGGGRSPDDRSGEGRGRVAEDLAVAGAPAPGGAP